MAAWPLAAEAGAAVDIAIIGAGIAGLSCARALGAAGHTVTLFDKGRGPGGRMSTRRTGGLCFDHGAQFFTARGADFRRQVAQWQALGVVAPWPAAGADAWVGTPGMDAPVADLAGHHDVHFSAHAMGLVRSGAHWQILLQGSGRHGLFDAAILALPAEQAAAFLGAHDLALAAHAIAARSQPCWTAMIGFEGRLPIAADVIRGVEPVVWAARNSAKPGRPAGEAWVVQAGAAWSARHLEAEAPDIDRQLAAWLAGQAAAAELPRQTFLAAHRWRYAMTRPATLGALWNGALRLGACGDWLLGPRIELAWQSGRDLAARIGADAHSRR